MNAPSETQGRFSGRPHDPDVTTHFELAVRLYAAGDLTAVQAIEKAAEFIAAWRVYRKDDKPSPAGTHR